MNNVCLKLTNGLSNQNCKWCFHCTAQFFCTLSLVTWSKHHWSAKILAALYNLRFNYTSVGHSFFIFGLGFIVNFVCSLFSQPHLWGFPRAAGLPPGALAKCWLFICGGFSKSCLLYECFIFYPVPEYKQSCSLLTGVHMHHIMFVYTSQRFFIR